MQDIEVKNEIIGESDETKTVVFSKEQIEAILLGKCGSTHGWNVTVFWQSGPSVGLLGGGVEACRITMERKRPIRADGSVLIRDVENMTAVERPSEDILDGPRVPRRIGVGFGPDNA